MATGKIELVDAHVPSIDTGDYTIAVNLEADSPSAGLSYKPAETIAEFSVSGARFTLSPSDVAGIFPPAGSLGDHANSFPHVALTRSTLPWERSALGSGTQPVPWLALLVLCSSDLEKGGQFPEPQTLKLKDLQAPATGAIKWPGIAPEPGQPSDTAVSVVDIATKVLKRIVPSREDLPLLVYVRRTPGDDAASDASEIAVVVGNRLPPPGADSMAYLVSVESRYAPQGFNYAGAADDDLIRFVLLKSWRFSCVDADHSFVGKFLGLDRSPLSLPIVSKNAETQASLDQGATLVPYAVRGGSETFAWYRGPLVPQKRNARFTDDFLAQVRVADALIEYSAETGLFDLSYASAWELGRLIALSDKSASLDFHNWKRTHRQLLLSAEQGLLHRHLPLQQDPTSVAVPVSVTRMFERLLGLESVPFNYLAPDDRFLPANSIRFFYVDPDWLACLGHGAFSIGSVHESDSRNASLSASSFVQTSAVTGLLLRSDVVAGWPNLRVEAFASPLSAAGQGAKLNTLRCARLSANVLICLFDGELASVDFFLPPETLHWEVDQSDGAGFSKTMRTSEGAFASGANSVLKGAFRANPTPLDGNSRVVDFRALADQSVSRMPPPPQHSTASAYLALQMLDGAPRVRFDSRAS